MTLLLPGADLSANQEGLICGQGGFVCSSGNEGGSVQRDDYSCCPYGFVITVSEFIVCREGKQFSLC